MAEPSQATQPTPRPRKKISASTTPASMASVRILGREFAPHKDIYHLILRVPWWAFFAGMALMFFGTNALFAIAYDLSPGCIDHVNDYEDAFYFSVQTLGTIGYGGMSPASRYGHLVVSIEAFTGLLMTAMVTGLTFAKFARPTARVLFTKYAIIHPRDGVPHLMFRMSNFRANNVVEATLRVGLMIVERTREGEIMRRAVDIPLTRASTALFFLSWTAMHKIDESSPFFSAEQRQKLRDEKAELFLSFTGLDETIAAQIHTRYRYAMTEVVENARFADILHQAEDGTRVLDYANFHEIIRNDPS